MELTPDERQIVACDLVGGIYFHDGLFCRRGTGLGSISHGSSISPHNHPTGLTSPF
jgi:hypothetical protein